MIAALWFLAYLLLTSLALAAVARFGATVPPRPTPPNTKDAA